MRYPIMIAPLSEADGGGFVGLAPDLYGCMSDGATAEEALANTQEAIDEWIDGSKELGRTIPEPGPAAPRAVEATKPPEPLCQEVQRRRMGQLAGDVLTSEDVWEGIGLAERDGRSKADDRCRRH